MPPFALDSQTVALECVPYVPALTDTPPPRSTLSRSGTIAEEPAASPEIGHEFCGFHLEEELGRGTFATVYLARQPALANRQVAVKVTSKPTLEHERLARLQHTNVVPVYSVHEVGTSQLICMPFLGRRTLAHAVSGRQPGAIAGLSTRKHVATKRGSSVAGSGTRSTTRLAPATPKSGTSLASVPEGETLVGNVEAILRILKQLADGLAHAHERGVLHLDLKLANVLIADTGEPMLLDFNLSFAEAEGKRELVGGTVPYMAPEQLHDLKQRGKGHVDARTDLYSLGVMAFELLTGRHPFAFNSRLATQFDSLIAARTAGAPSVRDTNPDVPAAVASIVAKLLAAKPEDRYQSAADLREDLDRQLQDRPLKFAPNGSIVERVGKWRRRNPKTLVVMVVALCLAAAGGAGAYAFEQNEKKNAREAESRVRETRDGLAAARLDLILPDAAGRTRGLKSAMGLLGAFELPANPNWQSTATFCSVPADQRAALAGDLGELLLLAARARLDEGKIADPAGATNDARILNRLAFTCFGDSPPPFAFRQRSEIDGEPLAESSPRTSRDWFLEGVSLVGALKHDAAVRPLEKAVALQPDHGAAQFLLARCRQQVGQYEAAVERYQLAGALLPNDPRPAYFRGVSLGLSGRHAAAEEAFDAVIELDPTFADAYQARGVSAMEQREYRDAERDFTTALEKGASKLQALHLRAYVRGVSQDEAGAVADRAAAAKLKPETDADLIARGFTQMKSNPRGAEADFRAAIAKNPGSLAARRNLIHVLADELNDDAAALKAASELVAAFPEYGYGRATRALCLARRGHREEAIREAEACEKLLRAKGPNYRDPNLVYRLARVYAAANDSTTAIRFLEDAFRSGFVGFEAVEKDREMNAIRDLPEYQAALKAAKELSN